ncbi:MAG: ankyrin repeat domain-containing protein [Rhodobacteraceae bacterium]|nr:ankyrin repeat domain-containing protein [Paracoccaceae bacterium]
MCQDLAGPHVNILADLTVRRDVSLFRDVSSLLVFAVAIALAGSSGAQDRAQDAWQDVSGCTDIAEVEAFILDFPESRFVEEARACLGVLGGFGLDVSIGPGEAARPGGEMPEMLEGILDLALDQRILVQHGLVILGHDVGVVDGAFGSRTRQGIAGYQQAKGLPSTGFLTSEQSDALMELGTARDELAWIAARMVDTPAAYRKYLSEFPRGVHSVRAHSWLSRHGQSGDDTAAAASEHEYRRFLEVVGRGPTASYVDENGWTDLHYAALLNLPWLCEALVDSGVAIDHRLKSDGRRLTDALMPKVQPFLESGVFLRRGHTPSHLAALGNAVDALERLVAKGASIHATNDVGRTPLHLAAWRNAVDALEWLVGNGAIINGTDDYGATPLHGAALGNAVDALEWLGTQGGSVHATSNYGRTPMHCAALGKAMDALDWLAANGASVHVTNINGNNPLHDAAWGNAADALAWLVVRGGDIHATNNIGRTPVHRAAEWNAVDALEWLVAKGASIDAKSIQGNTPLHDAASGNAIDAAAWLIARGADIDATNKYGNTPLHAAAERGSDELYDRLVAQGADVTARNADYETPSDIAETMGIGR